jgi:serine phosphatase RsbU (regulator of sigma subunit)
MKIRAQLAVVFFLLAVVPLSGLVLYSYLGSRRVVREAVAAEANETTRDMNRRMVEIESDLQRRVTRLGRLPLASLFQKPESEEGSEELLGWLLAEMGDAAPLVESFELVPEAPPPPPAAEPGQPPVPPPAPAAPGTPEAADEATAEATAEAAQEIGKVVLRVTDEVAREIERRYGDPDNLPEGSEMGAGEGIRFGLGLARAMAEAFGNPDPGNPGEEEPTAPHLTFGHELDAPIRQEGRVVGELRTRISAQELLRQVLARTRRDQGEIPFAVDGEGQLHVAEEADREALEKLLPETRDDDTPVVEAAGEQWLVARSRDAETGLEFGIARPLGEPLAAVRRSAARNLAYGLGLIVVALLGILPLSGRITRKLRLVTEGAERIAAGDLETRVPVGADDEVGQLARTFNQMARELREQKDRLISEERRRREEEVERQLLEAEYRRKSHELEEARQFQLSLLPQELPSHPTFDLAVHMRTATEVGGDYYDFHLDDDGTLLAVIGDATGHGARAGTMVTVVKSLFSSFPAVGGGDGGGGDGGEDDGDDLARFLAEANRTVRRMRLERMAMALTVLRLRHRRLTLATAGTPPALVYRRGRGAVEELEATGMPLGGLDFPYRQQHLDLAAGDRVLLTTDGFPELLDADGEPLGYRRARELFAAAAPRESAGEVLAELAAAVVERTGGQPPDDDVTFVLIEVR